ncbi:hypothetical protein [Adhaeribacter aquaticus]|nr:hypothetical protein [Adhaeribacter aquaticus]
MFLPRCVVTRAYNLGPHFPIYPPWQGGGIIVGGDGRRCIEAL